MKTLILIVLLLTGCGWIDEQLASISSTKVVLGDPKTTPEPVAPHKVDKGIDDYYDDDVAESDEELYEKVYNSKTPKTLLFAEIETNIIPTELSSMQFIGDNLLIAGRNANGHQTNIYQDVDGYFNILSNPSGIAAGSVSGEGDYIALSGRQWVGGDWNPSNYIYKLISGTYQYSQSVVPTQYGDIKLAYLRNSTLPDLIITGDNNGTLVTKIYFNNSGIFTDSGQAAIPNLKNSSISVGDIDNDGDLDILIAGETSSSSLITNLYLNNGSGNFSLLMSFIGIKNGEVFLVDLDNDDLLDVVVIGQSTLGNIAKVYHNIGSYQFEEVTDHGLPAVRTHDGNQTFSSRGIIISDLNTDNFPDIIVTGVGTDHLGTAKVFLGDGTGQFTEHSSLEPVVSGSVAVGDIDFNGSLDIVLIGRSGVPISKTYLSNWNN